MNKSLFIILIFFQININYSTEKKIVVGGTQKPSSDDNSIKPIVIGEKPSSPTIPIKKPIPINHDDDDYDEKGDEDEEDDGIEYCDSDILIKKVSDIALDPSDLNRLKQDPNYSSFIKSLKVEEYLEISKCYKDKVDGDFSPSITLGAFPALSMFPDIASTIVFTYEDKSKKEYKSCKFKCPCVGKSPTGPIFAASTSYEDRVAGKQIRFVCATTSQLSQSNEETVGGSATGGVIGGVAALGIIAALVQKLLDKEFEALKANKLGWAKFWRMFTRNPEIAKEDALEVVEEFNKERKTKFTSVEKDQLSDAIVRFLTGFYKDEDKKNKMPSRAAYKILLQKMIDAYYEIEKATNDTKEQGVAIKNFETSIVELTTGFFNRDKQNEAVFKDKIKTFLGDIQSVIFKNAGGVNGIKTIKNPDVVSLLEQSGKIIKGKAVYDFSNFTDKQLETLFSNFQDLPFKAQLDLGLEQAKRVAAVKSGTSNAKQAGKAVTFEPHQKPAAFRTIRGHDGTIYDNAYDGNPETTRDNLQVAYNGKKYLNLNTYSDMRMNELIK